MKCFRCIKDEKHGKIKWSAVQDAITIIDGYCFCYKHLSDEVGWNKEVRK